MRIHLYLRARSRGRGEDPCRRVPSDREVPEVDLSEQQVLSCDSTSWQNQANGCMGGYPTRVLDYIKDVGLVNESTFPYQPQASTQLSCPASFSQTTRVKIRNYITVPNTQQWQGVRNKDAAINAIKMPSTNMVPVVVDYDIYAPFQTTTPESIRIIRG